MPMQAVQLYVTCEHCEQLEVQATAIPDMLVYPSGVSAKQELLGVKNTKPASHVIQLVLLRQLLQFKPAIELQSWQSRVVVFPK